MQREVTLQGRDRLLRQEMAPRSVAEMEQRADSWLRAFSKSLKLANEPGKIVIGPMTLLLGYLISRDDRFIIEVFNFIYSCLFHSVRIQLKMLCQYLVIGYKHQTLATFSSQTFIAHEQTSLPYSFVFGVYWPYLGLLGRPSLRLLPPPPSLPHQAGYEQALEPP